MNYLIYLTKVMNITQNYNQHGNYSDFPFDEACSDSGRDYCYCPCDEIEVIRIYGVGNSGTNTIWLQSTTEVITPTFTDYVTIMIEHPNDDTLSLLKEGQKFTRGEAMFLEGDDGRSTGNHFHISVSKGKYVVPGWVENSYNLWGITGDARKPEECFYLDKSFTTVINSNGLEFTLLPDNLPKIVERDETKEQVEVIVDDLRVRTSPYINDNNVIGFIEKGIYNVINVISSDGYTWYEIEDSKWIANDGNYLIIYHVDKTTDDDENGTIDKEEDDSDNLNHIVKEDNILKKIGKCITNEIKKINNGKDKVVRWIRSKRPF